jgi:NAD(P)-dependent dehydrogenase (short-subunit alcohol dehydrogenase family)
MMVESVAVVIGASGGIGAALVAALRASGGYRDVVAFSRTSTPPLDITDEASLRDAAASLTPAVPLLVIDATGFLHDAAHRPEKAWRELDPAQMARAFALNAIGPALLMKHFLPLLPAQRRAVFATLSARVGSIGDNRLGGWYSYRASKAALNQFVRTAAIELARSRPQAICVALHPGTVATPLSAPFAKAGLAVRDSATAAQELLAVLARLTPADSGGFFDHKGLAVPW